MISNIKTLRDTLKRQFPWAGDDAIELSDLSINKARNLESECRALQGSLITQRDHYDSLVLERKRLRDSISRIENCIFFRAGRVLGICRKNKL